MIFLPIMTQRTRHIKPEHMSGPQPLHMQPIESDMESLQDLDAGTTDEELERRWKEAMIRTEMRHRRAGRGQSRPESGI